MIFDLGVLPAWKFIAVLDLMCICLKVVGLIFFLCSTNKVYLSLYSQPY